MVHVKQTYFKLVVQSYNEIQIVIHFSFLLVNYLGNPCGHNVRDF